MCWVSKVLTAIIILPAFFCPGFAQQVPNSLKGKRSVVVNVLDGHGDAVRDLAKENFRLRLNGKPVEVFDARYSFAPRRIIILLDESGSMTEEVQCEVANRTRGGGRLADCYTDRRADSHADVHQQRSRHI